MVIKYERIYSMIVKLMNYIKRIIPCIILFLFLFVMYLFNSHPTPSNNPVDLPDDVVPLSDGIQYHASFYLFNPTDFSPTFTNVTPDLCEYIGDGTVKFNDDVYNDPDNISQLIVKAPDYSGFVLPDKGVQWGSLYKYNDSICVVGLCSDAVVSNDPSADNKAYASVLDYGAIGDGQTDNTDAFTRAFSALAGQTIYIPSGTYIISGKVFIPSNTTILGDGRSSVIMASAGKPVGSDLLKISNASNITLSNITLSGNIIYNTREDGHSAKDGIHLLDVWNSNSLTVQNCNFIDNVYACIRIIGNCSDISVDNSNFENVDCGVITLGSGNVDSLSVSNSYFDGHQNSECVSLYSTGLHTNIIVKDNVMKNKIYGIAINFAKATVNNAKVLNNKISDCAVGIFLNHVSNAEVIENSIINTTALTNGGTGISATSCSNIYISNNIVTYTRQQGLYIKDCVSSNISKNTITDCGYQNNNYHCVDIHGTCSDLQIIGNTVIRNDTTLSPYSLVVNCNGSGTTNIQDTTVINSKLVLWSGSSNVNVSNTTGVTANLGTSNTITP